MFQLWDKKIREAKGKIKLWQSWKNDKKPQRFHRNFCKVGQVLEYENGKNERIIEEERTKYFEKFGAFENELK